MENREKAKDLFREDLKNHDSNIYMVKPVYCTAAIDAIEQALNIANVNQQRELLKKWWKYFDEESVAVNCNDEEREEVITNFFNCS